MYLIDTDILIYSLKGHSQVMEHLRETATAPKAVSVVSYGELPYGARKSARTDENLARVRRLGEVLPVIEVSRAIMEAFGSLKARLDQDGRRLDDFDLVIAATAITYRISFGDEQRKTLRSNRRPALGKLGQESPLKRSGSRQSPDATRPTGGGPRTRGPSPAKPRGSIDPVPRDPESGARAPPEHRATSVAR